MLKNLKWISVKDQPVPLDMNVIVSDGKGMQFCKFVVEKMSSKLAKMQVREYVRVELFGVTGYEFEEEIPFEFVTHWIDMGELELPR